MRVRLHVLIWVSLHKTTYNMNNDNHSVCLNVSNVCCGVAVSVLSAVCVRDFESD